MDLAQLEAFVAVVDEGTFTAAAARLHLSQPALSRRIATLEAELGVALFERVGRAVRLTPAGRDALDPARRSLHEAHRVRAAAASVGGLITGSLHLAGLPTLVISHLVPWVGSLHALHPGVQVALTGADDTAALLAMVASARCDLGICDDPGPMEDLQTALIGRQDLLAVLAPGSTLPEPRPGEVHPTIAIDELRDRPQVALPIGTSTRSLVDDLFAGGAAPPVVVTTDQRDALIPLVLTGVGMTFVPDRYADQAMAQGALVARPEPTASRDIVLVTRRGRLTPAAAAFVALAAA
jgi:DNA-binding transcriptional LysR family regulator